MVTLNLPNGHDLVLPTSLDEITLDYLNAVTKHVNLAPNYALVAVCIAATPFVRCDRNPKQSDGARAIFRIVRKNDPKSAIDAYPGETIISAGTEVMTGIETTCPKNIISTSKVGAMIMSCGKDASGRNIKNPYTDLTNPISSTTVYTVDFKTVPLNSIHGSYRKTTVSDNENIEKETEKFYK